MILVCGYRSPTALTPTQCDTSQAEAMAQYLIHKGMPRDRIIKEEKSTTTFGNAFYAAELIDYLNPQEMVIIANEFHLPSIEYSFKKVFGDKYAYRFQVIPDADLNLPFSELERWKAIIQEMVSHWYPMLFDHVENGDRKTLKAVIENPSIEFKQYVRKLLNLDSCENFRELISG